MATAIFDSGLSLTTMPVESDDPAESAAEHVRKQSESGTEPGSGVDSDGYDVSDNILEEGKNVIVKSKANNVSGKRNYQTMHGNSHSEKKLAAEKSLETLTGEEIQQLTREECRRYLKEKGMRRPSWNKAQATQQLLCLKNLLPLNTAMKDEMSSKDQSRDEDGSKGNHFKSESHPSTNSPNLPSSFSLFGKSLRSLEIKENELHNSNNAMPADSSTASEKMEKELLWSSMNYQQQQLLQNHLQQLQEQQQQRQLLQTQNKRESNFVLESSAEKATGGSGGGEGEGEGERGQEEKKHLQEINSRKENSKTERKMHATAVASEHSPPSKPSTRKNSRASRKQPSNQRRNSKNSNNSMASTPANDAPPKSKQEAEDSVQEVNVKEKNFMNSQGDNASNSSMSALKQLQLTSSLSPAFSFPTLSSLASIQGFQGMPPFSSNLDSILSALPLAPSSAPAAMSPALNQTSINQQFSQLQSLMPSFSPYQSSQTSLNPSSSPLPSTSFFPLNSINKSNPNLFNSNLTPSNFPSQFSSLKSVLEADGLSLIPNQSVFGSVNKPTATQNPDQGGLDSKIMAESSFSAPAPSILSLGLSCGESSRQDSMEIKSNSRIHRPNPTRPILQSPHPLLSNPAIKPVNEGKEKLSDPLNLTISLGSSLGLGSKDFSTIDKQKDGFNGQVMPPSHPDFASPLNSNIKSDEKTERGGFYQFHERPLNDHTSLSGVDAIRRDASQETSNPTPVVNAQSVFDRLFPSGNMLSSERNSAELQSQLSGWSTVIENLNKIRSSLPSDAFQSLNPNILNAAIMTSFSLPNLPSTNLHSTNVNMSENSNPSVITKPVLTSLSPETNVINPSVACNTSLPLFPSSSSSFATVSANRMNSEVETMSENRVLNTEKIGRMTIIYNGIVKTFDSVPADKANAIMLLAGNSVAPLLSQPFIDNSQLKSSISHPHLRFHTHPPSPSPPLSPPRPPQSADDAHHSSSPPSPAHRSLSPIRSTSSATSILPTSSPQLSPLNSLASQNPNLMQSHGSGFSEPIGQVRNEHMNSEVSGKELSSKKFQNSRVSGSKKSSNSSVLPPVSNLDQPEARKASLARFLEKRKERKQKLKNARS